jgi:hypothetical protein
MRSRCRSFKDGPSSTNDLNAGWERVDIAEISALRPWLAARHGDCQSKSRQKLSQLSSHKKDKSSRGAAG